MKVPSSSELFKTVQLSVDPFCPVAGITVLQKTMAEDVGALCGRVHGREPGRAAYRWGRMEGEVGYHGSKVTRPRVRDLAGREVVLPNWQAVRAGLSPVDYVDRLPAAARTHCGALVAQLCSTVDGSIGVPCEKCRHLHLNRLCQ